MAGNLRNSVTGSLGSLLLLIILLTLTGVRCGDDNDPEFIFMAFLVPITITPPSDEFHVGDTLWISGSFPDTLEEFYSGKYYRFENFDFKSKICLHKLVNNQKNIGEQPGAFDYFSIINKAGSLQQISSICGSVSFDYRDGKYNYRIGLLTTIVGIFTINFLWPINLHGMPDEHIDLKTIIDLGTTTDGRRKIPVYEAFYFVVNEGNTNFELFKENCKAESLTNPAPINVFYEQKGSFTFRVVE